MHDALKDVPHDRRQTAADVLRDATRLRKPGGKLRTARQLLGLTQEAFGEILNVAQPHISDWERDKYQPAEARCDDLKALASELEEQ
jgi:DNA-binding transcriptional regulator YiaG